MNNLKKRSTTIHEDVRRMLGISRDAYAFCAYVHYRCADSRQKRPGWCCDNKQEVADFVGVTRPGLYKMGERLAEIGLVEISNFGDYRATPKWIDLEADCKQSLQKEQQENVNKVYKKCKQSLQKSSKNVNKVYTDTYILELENKREKEDEKNLSPSPDSNLLFKAQTKEKDIAPTAGPGLVVEVHDGEVGATIYEEIKPVTEPPPHRVNLGDRPNADTPVQLEAALRNFYIAWPNEWSVGILENGKGRKYPFEQQKEIVKDFCCWAVKNNQQRDTYQQLNAALQSWFRNEQYSGWKKSKPEIQTTPDHNFYRRNPTTK